MSILLSDNFQYWGRKPLDSRLVYDTLADMAAMTDATLYEGIIAYNLEDSKFYTFNPSNPVDPTLGKWVELTLGGSGNASIEEYAQGQDYKKDTLIIKDGKLYIVNQDFTSDNTEANANDSFELDVTSGNISPVELDGSKFMPLAPKEYKYNITNGGTGYAVNEVVATDVTDVNVIVKEIEMTTGEILKVEATDKTPLTTAGSGAVIKATKKIYAGFDDLWMEIPEQQGGTANLIRDITSNVEVGGAPSGTLFAKDTDFTTVMEMLLRTAIMPKITFSASGSGVREKGTTLNGSILKLTISNEADVTVPMTKIEFKVNGAVVDTQTVTAGTSVYDFNYTDPITTDTTFSAVLTYDDDNKTMSGKDGVVFVYASYVGAVNTNAPDETMISGLTKIVKNTKAYDWNNITLNDERYCYAYPASLGNLTSIKDANNFEYINSYIKSAVTFANGASYNIYVLTDPVTITGAKQSYK